MRQIWLLLLVALLGWPEALSSAQDASEGFNASVVTVVVDSLAEPGEG